MKRIELLPDDAGKRLDLFLSEKEELTRSRAQKLIEDGCVHVNGAAKPKNYKMQTGDAVGIEYPPIVPDEAQAEDISLSVVYEDDDLLVVNKPKGMVVHPAAGNETGTLVNALLAHCGASLSGIGGVARPGIVHRIDKNTSGLLIVAKNDKAHLSLAGQIKAHSAARTYFAVALGKIEAPLTIDKPIGRSPSDRKKMAIEPKNGRNAVTHVTPLEEFKGATLIRCDLETGRTHQIRVHLASIGHPILGDDVYGRPKDPVEQRFGKTLTGQTLHAGEIRFVHPVSGKEMHFTAPLPPYFEEILRKLRAATGDMK